MSAGSSPGSGRAAGSTRIGDDGLVERQGGGHLGADEVLGIVEPPDTVAVSRQPARTDEHQHDIARADPPLQGHAEVLGRMERLHVDEDAPGPTYRLDR